VHVATIIASLLRDAPLNVAPAIRSLRCISTLLFICTFLKAVLWTLHGGIYTNVLLVWL